MVMCDVSDVAPIPQLWRVKIRRRCFFACGTTDCNVRSWPSCYIISLTPLYEESEDGKIRKRRHEMFEVGRIWKEAAMAISRDIRSDDSRLWFCDCRGLSVSRALESATCRAFSETWRVSSRRKMSLRITSCSGFTTSVSFCLCTN